MGKTSQSESIKLRNKVMAKNLKRIKSENTSLKNKLKKKFTKKEVLTQFKPTLVKKRKKSKKTKKKTTKKKK